MRYAFLLWKIVDWDEAIAELVDEAQTSGFPTVFHLVGKSLPIDSKSALALYRVAQEGLTNISKHAQATHTEVTLDFSQTAFVRITLIDDGVGAAKTRSGFGLGRNSRTCTIVGKLRNQCGNSGWQRIST